MSKIITEHDVNDVMFFMKDNKIVSSKIKAIFITIKEDSVNITNYVYGESKEYNSSELFKTKESLINTL